MTSIVDEFRRLAQDQPDIAGFYRQSIEYIADRLDAQAVMVWNCTELPYHPIQQLSRDSDSPIKVGISQQQHIALLERAVNNEQPTLSSATNSPDDGSSHLLLCPVQRGNHRDLVEVFVRADQSGSTYVHNKAELQACCQAISQSISEKTGAKTFKNVSVDPSPTDQGSVQFSLERFDQFIDNVHQSIDHKATCYNIANEAQSLLGCDRVVVVKFDHKAKAVAISGLPKFNRRSNAINSLEKLATTVLKTKQPFWYPDPDSEPLPQIAEKLDRYLADGVSRSLVIVPIMEGRGDTRLAPEEIHFEKKSAVIGAVIFENFSGEWQKQQMIEPISIVGRHAGSAYRNAYEHKDLFLYPVWRSLGKLKGLTSPRHLSKTLLASGLAVLLLASLFFVPARMTVSGDGKLVPVVRRTVFAQVGGQIANIAVQHGSEVEAGEVLLQMVDSDLKMGLGEIENKIELTKKQIEALDSQRMSAMTGEKTPEQMARDDLEHSSLTNQLENYKNERDLFQQEVDRMSVESPITGQVISTDLRKQLMDRPVRSGQILMEVADTDGPWIIEMDLPDRRIGHLYRAQKELGKELKATFILAADPGKKLSGTVFDVALATQVMQDSGQSIKIKIRIDNPEDLDIRQVGTDATVKIDCGECSLGYSMFRDLGEFFQSKVMFYFQ